MWSISYPADEHYKSVALEASRQLIAASRALVNLYVLNTGANAVYLLVADDAAGPHALGANTPGTVYPIAGNGSYISIATHGGDQFAHGIYVAGYSTAALAIAGGAPDCGAVLLIKADWRAGLLP